MVKITDKAMCCGCTACKSVCPQNCIEMQPDFEGFLYPHIDEEQCIECGLCNKVCPIDSPIILAKEKKESYAVRSKDSSIIMKSTSGGFISPLARWVLKNDGIICAASYDENFKVIHVLIDRNNATENVFEKMRGSKYVQSYLGDIFVKIKNILTKGKLVCFVGTTCQVSGLKAFLKKDYNNLITVDLVCHGTPSPKLWEKYLKFQEKKYNSKIKKVNFRNKTYGYHSSTMTICFENGKTYNGSARIDYMLKCFFKEISSRPSCYNCAFKTVERCSDFTIYDCWHIEQLAGRKDDDRGYTNVIVQSNKGKSILEEMLDELEVYSVDTELAIELDGIMVQNSAKPHPMRENFYKTIDEESLEDIVQRYIPVSKKDRILENIKAMLYHLGILRLVKKIAK